MPDFLAGVELVDDDESDELEVVELSLAAGLAVSLDEELDRLSLR